MQTFLPYPSFHDSAACLDAKRLGKQRSETMIIFNTLTGLYAASGRKGWPNHPATKMWTGYEPALAYYGFVICQEWLGRGYRGDETLRWFMLRCDEAFAFDPYSVERMPPWFGNPEFHASHRSNLLRKDPDHYRNYWPDEPDDLPYVWPDPSTWLGGVLDVAGHCSNGVEAVPMQPV